MANIVITKTGDIMEAVYNDQAGKYEKFATNVVTDERVGLLVGDVGVETNLLCTQLMQYDYTMVDTIAGVSITSNAILYTELKNML